MAKLKCVLLTVCLLVVVFLAHAGTYTLTDGQTINGEPTAYDANGVVFRLPSGGFSSRTPWSKFSQESLHQLMGEAKKETDAEFIRPYLEETAVEEEQQAKITVTPPETPERPTGNTGLSAMFSSSLGLFLFAVLYAANLYAALEVARFKNLPVAVVCGASAVLPFLAPIVFLFIPRRADAIDAAAHDAAHQVTSAEAERLAAEQHGHGAPAHPEHHEHHQHHEEAPANPPVEFALPPEPVSAPAPAHPSVTFTKGQFTFNRRFFETKMPGFFRAVPSEADKDMVVVVKAIRGEFVAKRIPKITQTEIHLETFKGHATAEEVVPFTEIQEVSIRHKDSI